MSRASLGDRPVPPERIVHLGLGAFHRAHQAWYTAHATDAADWGIVAFTGRSPQLADRLAAQQGVYTLVERGTGGDRHEAIGSIVRAEPGSDVGAFVTAVAHPRTAILTLTVTEAAYRFAPGGGLDLSDPAVSADIDLFRNLSRVRTEHRLAYPTTVLGRTLLGLRARHRAAAPPLAIVPCDNLAANGDVVRRALETFAAQVSPALRDWLPTGVRVVSTSVDRITPRVTVQETGRVKEATGWRDEVPVVTEPFADWVLAGDFPAGRPAWDSAGARFVAEIGPWETRKLWLLNGAHSLLAATGPLRGHTTVAQAFADPSCRAAVEALWDEASRHLPDLALDDYRTALAERFANPRIEHHLAQIAEDSLTKLRLRIVPVARRERRAGRPATACAVAVGAWIAAGGGSLGELDPQLAADHDFRTAVHQARKTLPGGSRVDAG
ncbi:mannitol dehydrogenase [Actinoplanes palleronii]|uniref:Mannitol dehydrogenase n=1 Tax=Actinoplanes palleronii TaxID=113570 RepID=A0ABQ4BJ02_9ACTN|nr:mannitol dehydrogenase [Actinoplanes palleronii]